MPDKNEILVFIDWYLPSYKAGEPIQSVVNNKFLKKFEMLKLKRYNFAIVLRFLQTM
jgi:hypothetical protein